MNVRPKLWKCSQFRLLFGEPDLFLGAVGENLANPWPQFEEHFEILDKNAKSNIRQIAASLVRSHSGAEQIIAHDCRPTWMEDTKNNIISPIIFNLRRLSVTVLSLAIMEMSSFFKMPVQELANIVCKEEPVWSDDPFSA